MYRHTMAAALRSWATFAEDNELAARLDDLKLPARLRRGTREPLEQEQWFQSQRRLSPMFRFPPRFGLRF